MNSAFLLGAALCAAPAVNPVGPTLAQPQPAPLPRYPIGWLALPDFLAPDDPLTLTDFSYAGPETSGGEHAWSARVRWLGLGYVTAELVGERHGLSFLGHRLSLAVSSEDGDWTLGAGFRTSRFIFSADGRSSVARGGRDWVYGPTLQFRLIPDVELYGWVQGDTARPKERSVTELGAGTLWQRGAWLEANLQYARAYETTSAGDENRVDTAQASLVAQVARAEIAAFTGFKDTGAASRGARARPTCACACRSCSACCSKQTAAASSTPRRARWATRTARSSAGSAGASRFRGPGAWPVARWRSRAWPRGRASTSSGRSATKRSASSASGSPSRAGRGSFGQRRQRYTVRKSRSAQCR